MQIWQDIKSAKDWDWIQPLPPGKSEHPKYFIQDRHGQEFFLKVTPAKDYPRKREQFLQLKALAARHDCVPRPIDIGLCAGGQCSYSLQEWIYGQPLMHKLQSYSHCEQYELGVTLGLALKKVHSQTVLDKARCRRVHQRFMLQARHIIACGEALVNEDRLCRPLLSFARHNLNRLGEGPCSLLHGNVQPRHALLTPSAGTSLIDFDRFSYGHPLAELATFFIDWRRFSDAFRIAVLDVYLANGFSGRHFLKLSAFIALELIRRGIEPDSQTFEHLSSMEKVLQDFDEFRMTIPAWYRPLPFDELIGERMRL